MFKFIEIKISRLTCNLLFSKLKKFKIRNNVIRIKTNFQSLKRNFLKNHLFREDI